MSHAQSEVLTINGYSSFEFEKMVSDEGRAKYKLRQQTVEPVFAIIKEVLGFRRFHLLPEFFATCRLSRHRPVMLPLLSVPETRGVA